MHRLQYLDRKVFASKIFQGLFFFERYSQTIHFLRDISRNLITAKNFQNFSLQEVHDIGALGKQLQIMLQTCH